MCLAIETPGRFRWQEVACSPECGAIYLERIERSRSQLPSAADVLSVDEASDDKVDVNKDSEEKSKGKKSK